MKTSYYKSPLLKPDMNLVRISTSSPKWFPWALRPYPKLYPGWDLVRGYKEGRANEAEAREGYYAKILSKLNPQEVFADLGEDAVLLCWEKSGTFCHRRIVAEWFRDRLDIRVDELSQ